MRRRALVRALLCLPITMSCARAPEPGDLSGWNVLLVTIDTLRADRVGFAGSEAARTPVLDELAGEGVVFEDAVAAAPVTLPSHATILTGLYPPSHGALDNGFYSLPEDVPTLATILQGRGYQTAAVVGAYVLHRQYGLDLGFDLYDDFFRRPQVWTRDHGGRRAEDVTANALRWLRDRDESRPFLLWAHYYDPHAPYESPPGFSADHPYDAEVAYTDHWIGELLDGLRESGAGSRTLVVVVSDHGEAFGDGGEVTHGLLLRGGTLEIPMLMSAPGVLPAGRRVTGAASHADLAPTILELLGIESPAPADGRSLLAGVAAGELGERWVYSETRLPEDMHGWSMLAGVRSERWAWVRAPRPELYDLVVDPQETENVVEAHPDLAAELDRRVQDVLTGERGAARTQLSDEDLAALRALGYVFSKEAPAPTGADPKDMIGTWTRLNALRIALERGELATALAGLGDLLDRDPGNHEARMLRGQGLVQAGRVEEGIREFREVFEAGVVLGRAGTLFAKTLADAGRLEESEALLRSFVRAEPKYAEHAYNLGVLLSGQGRHEEALEAYEAAYARNPEAVHVLANLAQTMSELPSAPERSERAIELLERSIELSPNDDRPRLMLVEVCTRLGLEDRAREEVEILSRRPRLKEITREELAAAIRRLEGRKTTSPGLRGNPA